MNRFCKRVRSVRLCGGMAVPCVLGRAYIFCEQLKTRHTSANVMYCRLYVTYIYMRLLLYKRTRAIRVCALCFMRQRVTTLALLARHNMHMTFKYRYLRRSHSGSCARACDVNRLAQRDNSIYAAYIYIIREHTDDDDNDTRYAL